MAKIEEHKYTIEEAFRECFYLVPDYQREYVWTEKEVRQLLEDIDETFDGTEREYFIGTVLVSATSERAHFEVIDGQQRLTTLFLLLCALRQHFAGEALHAMLSSLLATSFTDKNGNLNTSLKLEPRYDHASRLMGLIVEADADSKTTATKVRAAEVPQFGSLERLLSAYSTIHSFLDENYKTRERLQKYWGHLANHVVFIQISTDVSNALKIFETINERGVGLNPMDLLKNLLFTQVAGRLARRPTLRPIDRGDRVLVAQPRHVVRDGLVAKLHAVVELAVGEPGIAHAQLDVAHLGRWDRERDAGLTMTMSHIVGRHLLLSAQGAFSR